MSSGHLSQTLTDDSIRLNAAKRNIVVEVLAPHIPPQLLRFPGPHRHCFMALAMWVAAPIKGSGGFCGVGDWRTFRMWRAWSQNGYAVVCPFLARPFISQPLSGLGDDPRFLKLRFWGQVSESRPSFFAVYCGRAEEVMSSKMARLGDIAATGLSSRFAAKRRYNFRCLAENQNVVELPAQSSIPQCVRR